MSFPPKAIRSSKIILGDREATIVSSTMTKVTEVDAIWAANFAFDKFTDDLDVAEFIKKVFEKKYQ